MKKIFALMLCMMLLLSGCGYLGGASDALVELRDLYIDDGDTTVDMRGLSAGVELGCSGDAYGLRLTISADEELKNQLVAAVVDDSVLILLDGGAGEPYAFAIDDPQVVGPIQEAFDEMMAAGQSMPQDMDLEHMTDEELDEYMSQLEDQLRSMAVGDDQDQDPEDTAEAAARAERISEILQSCVSEGEPMEFEGEMYQTTNFELPHEQLMELLGLLDEQQLLDADTDLAQLLEEADITVDVTGVIASTEDGSKNAFGATPVFTNADGEAVTLNITLQQLSEDGSLDFYMDINDDGQDVGMLSMTFNAQLLDEADWLPDGLPEDAQTLEPDDEASMDAFTDALSDFFGQVAGTMTGVMAGNGAVGALE